MTCEQAAELLSAYVDGELNRSERGELVGHLESCLACRREWVAAERARALSSGAAPAMPTVLRARIERSIDEWVGEGAPSAWTWREALRWPALVPAPAWAVVATALTAGIAAYSLYPREEPVPLDRLLSEHVLTDQQTWAAGRGWMAAGMEEMPSEEGG